MTLELVTFGLEVLAHFHSLPTPKGTTFRDQQNIVQALIDLCAWLMNNSDNCDSKL